MPMDCSSLRFVGLDADRERATRAVDPGTVSDSAGRDVPSFAASWILIENHALPRSAKSARARHVDAASAALDCGGQSIRNPYGSRSRRTAGRRVRSARGDGVRRRRRRRRTRGSLGRDPAEAARCRARHGSQCLRAGERFGGRGTHIVRLRDGPPRHRRAHARLEGQGRAARHAGRRGSLPVPVRDEGHADAELGPAFDLPEPRQLHRQPRQRGPVARPAGRGAGRRDLPGFSGRAGAVRRRGQGPRRRHGRHGDRQGRRADRRVPARHGTACKVHAFRGRLARQPRQAAAGTLRAASRRRPSELRHRHQGTVGDRSREAQGRTRGPHGRLAARERHVWRLVPVPHGEPSGRDRFRGRPRLHQSLAVAVRGVPALQDASRDPHLPRRRQARVVRRAGHHRGWARCRCRSSCSPAAR